MRTMMFTACLSSHTFQCYINTSQSYFHSYICSDFMFCARPVGSLSVEVGTLPFLTKVGQHYAWKTNNDDIIILYYIVD